MFASKVAQLGLVGLAIAQSQLDAIPTGFNASRWAWVSNENSLLAVIPGEFNRSGFDAPRQPKSLTAELPPFQYINEQTNQTSFVAYDPRFFDISGPTRQWSRMGGPGGGENSCHDYQYLLDLKINNLTTVRINPPTWNVRGCVYSKGKLHVVTDGGPHETGYLATIDPSTWERTRILNNHDEQSFISFNDLDMDCEGNYDLTDSLSRAGPARPVGRPTWAPRRPRAASGCRCSRTGGCSPAPSNTSTTASAPAAAAGSSAPGARSWMSWTRSPAGFWARSGWVEGAMSPL
ncbi:hypothetical protein PG994_012820 [Apiospora phragmitis]|uniref:Uncharacterized protein n=1 Tax=Apiospora phragmitis TaxID=2905665 RepID=A0ABR1T7D1_9PEZI